MSIIDRLQKTMPAHIKPVARTVEEHLAMMDKISQQRIEVEEAQNKIDRVKLVMGRAGISPLHQDCTFSNYIVTNQGQRAALNSAKDYAEKFDGGLSSFVFSGDCGTGKNHLAAAICNSLLARGKTVLCISLPDLMSKFRESYDKNSSLTSHGLLNELVRVDLLILDEIGIQHSNSDNTSIIINQIVDKRTSSLKSIGMLTNLDYTGMESKLGRRVVDRMTMRGIWVNFNWESYRSRV